jgi:ribosomal protein S18 acetylase RimI-like enzyme
MHFEFDAARADDIPQLCELLNILFAQEHDFQPDAGKQMRGLRLIIEHPEFGKIFVCRDGARVVGMVSLLFTISTASGAQIASLEDVIVRSEQRNSGIGAELIRHAFAFSRRSGFAYIALLTDATNEHAIRFYKRRGFRVHKSKLMRLRL